MNIYSIYRAVNIITGKSYFGFTSKTIEHRAKRHKISALKGNSQTKFHKAIREYGWDSFVFEYYYQSKEQNDPRRSYTLTVMEDYFIQEHNSIEDGYNTSRGGGVYPILRGSNHPLYGIGHSDNTKQKIKENHHDVSGSNNPKARKIIIILPNGERVESFGNLEQVCESHKIKSYVIAQMLIKNKRVLVRGKNKGLQAYYDSESDIDVLKKTEITDLIKIDVDRRLKIINSIDRCIHCSLETTRGNLKRWHNDNCKLAK